MRKVLLDADILSEYLKAHDESAAWQGEAYLRVHPFFTFTSITVYEITYGLRVKNADRQLIPLGGILSLFGRPVIGR